MGRAAEHFGHDPAKAGEKAARDVADGKITRKELRDKYQQAKDIGYGDDFKQGYAKGADRVFNRGG